MSIRLSRLTPFLKRLVEFKVGEEFYCVDVDYDGVNIGSCLYRKIHPYKNVQSVYTHPEAPFVATPTDLRGGGQFILKSDLEKLK